MESKRMVLLNLFAGQQWRGRLREWLLVYCLLRLPISNSVDLIAVISGFAFLKILFSPLLFLYL